MQQGIFSDIDITPGYMTIGHTTHRYGEAVSTWRRSPACRLKRITPTMRLGKCAATSTSLACAETRSSNAP